MTLAALVWAMRAVALACAAAVGVAQQDVPPWLALNAEPVGLAANRTAPRRFHVFGERNSGTNYLRYVIEANLRGDKLSEAIETFHSAGWVVAAAEAAASTGMSLPVMAGPPIRPRLESG